MTERQFTKDVLDHCMRFGWRAVHFTNSRGPKGEHRTAYLGEGKGFPDIVAVRERIILAELKVPPYKQTTDQLLWQKQLQRAGVEFYLWTPQDEEDIVKILAGSRPPRTTVHDHL